MSESKKFNYKTAFWIAGSLLALGVVAAALHFTGVIGPKTNQDEEKEEESGK